MKTRISSLSKAFSTSDLLVPAQEFINDFPAQVNDALQRKVDDADGPYPVTADNLRMLADVVATMIYKLAVVLDVSTPTWPHVTCIDVDGQPEFTIEIALPPKLRKALEKSGFIDTTKKKKSTGKRRGRGGKGGWV